MKQKLEQNAVTFSYIILLPLRTQWSSLHLLTVPKLSFWKENKKIKPRG